MTEKQIVIYIVIGFYLILAAEIVWACWPWINEYRMNRKRKSEKARQLLVADAEFSRQLEKLMRACDQAANPISTSHVSSSKPWPRS